MFYKSLLNYYVFKKTKQHARQFEVVATQLEGYIAKRVDVWHSAVKILEQELEDMGDYELAGYSMEKISSHWELLEKMVIHFSL